MALIECEECGATVSSKAPACPKCGNPISQAPVTTHRPLIAEAASAAVPTSRNTLKGVLVGVVIAIIGIFVLISALTSKSSDSPSSQETASTTLAAPNTATGADSSASDNAQAAQTATYTAPPEPPAPRVIEISAPQLYAEYKENEVLADTKYKGQWLYVTGTVIEIGKDFTDDPFVTLIGESEYSNVRALFTKASIGQLASLRKGQNIGLTCLGKGRLLSDAIIDCKQDNVPARTRSPAATTSAAQDGASAAAASAFAAASSSPTLTASFDCKKAHSTSEMLICGDADLAALDVALATMFEQAKAAATDKQAFSDMTRRNWNWRNKNCVDKNCLVHWYADQRRQFLEILNPVTQASGEQPAGDVTKSAQIQTASASSEGYGEKVGRRVKPNIVWAGGSVAQEAVIAVRCAPTGTLLSATIATSSGNDQWDEAALRAVQRSDPMPVGTDGRAPAEFTIGMRP